MTFFFSSSMQRRWTEGSKDRSGGRRELGLAGRKKCRGDKVQSGLLNVPRQNWSARTAVLRWIGEKCALVYTDDEV